MQSKVEGEGSDVPVHDQPVTEDPRQPGRKASPTSGEGAASAWQRMEALRESHARDKPRGRN
jgi:hypothetical protein